MGHYAKVVNGIVEQVIVAEPEFFDTFVDSSAGEWLETSYDGSIRKNYAGVGCTYDIARDAFIIPKLYPSWVLVEDTCQWEAPTPHPTDGNKYNWNESTTAWVLVA